MLFTIFLLFLVYMAFLAILAYHGAGMVTMLAFVIIFMLVQYLFSDRLVLKSMGAKIVSEREEPRASPDHLEALRPGGPAEAQNSRRQYLVA